MKRFFKRRICAACVLTWPVLLGQTADVGHKALDVRVVELAAVSRHLAFALGDDVGELGIGLGFHFRRCEVAGSHLPALAVRAMAHGAFCFEGCRRVLCDCRRRAGSHHAARQQSYEAHSKRDKFHVASS